MAMNRQNYLEMIIAFLTRLKDETGFNLETPLDHGSRIKLAAIANSADNMGEKEIGRMIKKALSSNDPKTQEILLYSGISQGPLSDKDIPSALAIASNKLQSMGGNPDEIASQALEPPATLGGPEGEDPLADLIGDEESDDPGDDSLGDDPLGDLLDDEPTDDEDGEAAQDAPEEREEDDLPEDPEDELDGRIAKEGDDEEADDVPEPEPMNDWFVRFVLD